MNKYDYKNICPFKWFVLENFPFIEDDFDALTNWQLFCKIGKEINKIIKSQNEVGQAVEDFTQKFIVLYNFVHDFFDNLDVQEEINNKLDEMVEDGTLQNILMNYANVQRIYDTTVEMLEDSENLVNGMKVKTLGYYEINDGGGAEFIITNIENNLQYQIPVNSMFAELIINNNTINILTLGAKNDGTTDTTEIINKALQCNANNIYLPKGQYLISDTINMPFNKRFYGDNNIDSILLLDDFNDYAIIYGDSYNYASKQGKIENIRLQSIEGNSTNGIAIRSGIELNNVYFYRLKRAITKNTNYIDNIVINRCTFAYCSGNNPSYVVELKGNMDAFSMKNCQFVSSYDKLSFNEYLGILIQSSTGGSINNCILNVPVTINNVNGLSINNTHMEGSTPTSEFNFTGNLSYFKIQNSNVQIENMYIHKNVEKGEFILSATDYKDTLTANNIILKNILIDSTSPNLKYMQNTNNLYNIEKDLLTTLQIENCFNSFDFSASWNSTNGTSGIKIKDLEDYNKHSSYLSYKSIISLNNNILTDIPIVKDNDLYVDSNVVQNSNSNKYFPWFETGFNNNSIWVTAVFCFDFQRKLALFRNPNSVEITGITSYTDSQNHGKGAMIRNSKSYITDGLGLQVLIYRGNERNIFNKITKIPVCCSNYLFDFGTNINGYPTEDRISGDVDTFNYVKEFKTIGNNVEFKASSIPTVGTFVKGDKCINTNISSGNVISWIYDGTNWIPTGTY